MKAEKLIEIIGSDFYTGVPDSQLRPLCDYLMDRYGIDKEHHIIAANEGNCVGIGAGYHLATGKIPVVYMQNSGEGNIINPVASLLNDKVYAIPMVFIIGWRGEPGVHDEPQHVFQGEITCKLLDDLDISYFIIDPSTSDSEVAQAMEAFGDKLESGKQVAFIVRKGALSVDKKVQYSNGHSLVREDVIKKITEFAGDGIIVSTTGKISRELYEIRDKDGFGHANDFLTVGSMGHSSSIALGIALSKPGEKVWCIDGDGAALMHMGAMAVIGTNSPENLVHIVINNGAHETVGGMPTVAASSDIYKIALACGYPNAMMADDEESLEAALKAAAGSEELIFIEVKTAIGSRADLGRPKTTPVENKRELMKRVNGGC